MNISYNWLKQYIEVDLSAEEVAAALTSVGLETGTLEIVESIRGGLKGLVIGKVLTCVDHPDSDHLHITTVDLGDGKATQIVCGAPNVAAGQTVVVATVGTTLYDGDKEFQIKKSKIRGQESYGMICAEDEIGVGTSHDGIIVIQEDVAPGTSAAEYFKITEDHVIEVDLTPNRVDAASHYGVARDLSAWMCRHNKPAKPHRPSVDSFKVDRPDGAIAVEVLNNEACPRYCGQTIRGVKVAESPQWLKDRLTAIGVRPINNVVDITNYLLHAMGQPLHCFDLDKIKGDKVVVRTVAQGTKFVTLDEVERELDERDLMICNTEEPMCIAGVFGGLDSGVKDTTTDIFLESAYFHPTWIRKTARRHGLQTDASFRYERGADPNAAMYVLKLAALMVKELAGGEICGEPVDIYPDPINPWPVTLSYDYIDRLIGKHIPATEVDAIMESLEMEIVGHGDNNVTVLVPTYRVDVQRPCDVVEDILRIYGYNNVEIGTELHASLSYKQKTDEDNQLRVIISEQLTGLGFNEILCNSLTAVRYYEPLTEEYPLAHCVKLLNPLSNDLGVMRQTLLFGGLESLSRNINRRRPDLMTYEFGNVYSFKPEAESTDSTPLAPYSEGARLALWMTGNFHPTNWLSKGEETTVYHLRGVVDNIFARLGINPRELKFTQTKTELMSAAIDIATRSGKHLGIIGIVAKAVLNQSDIKQPVFFAELDWNALVNLAVKKSVSFTPLEKTLPVKRDLALLIENSVTMEQIENVIRESERKLLREVSLFDVYEGQNLPEGKKSYAVSITLQDSEKTLQDKQIEAAMNKIVTNLTKKLNAQLR